MTTSEQFTWQQRGTAWKGAGIYHITLTIPSREQLLGTLVIPDNDPAKAEVERKELGKEVIKCLAKIQSHYPEIELLKYALMPDHVHAIIRVRHALPVGIATVVRGFWQGCKKAGRAYILSFHPDTIRNKKQNFTPESIFTEMPFVRPLVRKGQLNAMMRYVQMNPQRLATKLLNPGYFCVQRDIEIAGRIYSGVGNTKLLMQSRLEPVHVRSEAVRKAQEGNTQPLRDYMNGCVIDARNGVVMVSPFISEKEKEVMHVLLAEGLPFIILTNNGFRDYYKPSDTLFEAVDQGRVLILSPWEHDPKKTHISREECLALNGIAEEICGGWILG